MSEKDKDEIQPKEALITVWVDGVPVEVLLQADTEIHRQVRENLLKKALPGVVDIQFGPSVKITVPEEYSQKYERNQYVPTSVRREVVERDRMCQDCGKEGEHVHHLSYDPPITPDDLVYLCEKCHADRHRAITGPIHDAAVAAFAQGESETQAHVTEEAKRRAPWHFD